MPASMVSLVTIGQSPRPDIRTTYEVIPGPAGEGKGRNAERAEAAENAEEKNEELSL